MGQPQTEAMTNAVGVDGLDHVFVDVIEGQVVQGIPAANQGAPQEIPKGVPADKQDTPEGIPVDEAARILGTSSRAVIKRLQKGTLAGFKVPSKFGDKWLVDPKGLPVDSEGTPQEIPQGVPADKQNSPQGVPVEIVQELMRKIEALTYRNGYLEAQLAEKETHIKLLTDSQHNKESRWMRFRSWFSRWSK